jgi:hypothetical protein
MVVLVMRHAVKRHRQSHQHAGRQCGSPHHARATTSRRAVLVVMVMMVDVHGRRHLMTEARHAGEARHHARRAESGHVM